MSNFTLTRRNFMVAGALVGGGLAVGCSFDGNHRDSAALRATTDEGEIALNAWVKVDQDGKVTVAIPRSEMGQGVYTALAMLVAEEMDVYFADVTAEQSPVDDVYANITLIQDSLPFNDGYHKGEDTVGAWAMEKVGRLLGVQVTGGSTSVRDAWAPMRQAGAMAKAMLVSAAAKSWGVPASECEVRNGIISHREEGREGSYGEFVAAAAEEAVSIEPKLKDASEFKLIGTPQKRLDIPAKVDGSAVFGTDIMLDGMVHAAVRLAPTLDGTLESHDPAPAMEMPGVLKVVPLENAVAVVADSFWRAKSAVEALDPVFTEGPAKEYSSASIMARLEEKLQDGDARDYAEAGDVKTAFEESPPTIEAIYKVPYLAHACMEPMNCTALLTDETLDIWMPNQAPTLMKWYAGDLVDIDSENIRIHTPYLGGGFGRRAEIDLAVMAVAIAREMKGRPVKLQWTREDDMQHDMYRPAALSRFRGSLDSGGKMAGWDNRIVSQSVGGSFTARLLPWMTMDRSDNTTAEGAADLPYEFPNLRVDHVPVELLVPVGFWRSVGHSYNAFFTESFMDEMAHAAGQDPVAFRFAHLTTHPDFSTVLKKLVQVSAWDAPLAAGRGRGVALHESYGSIVGQVVEVTVGADKALTVDKVFCVVDCGTVVNPDTVTAQMEGGIIFGLTAALYGEIEIENGVVINGNFPDYEMVRLANCPDIEVHLAPSRRRMGGIGEPGTPPIAPALANAIFAATGERVRELPLSKAGFTA
ncbi:xanthine dehydrogenase family protein molybdopterin-binding subunit [uncultured Sneathiella sp.]|uniref:xanthine dehydrogenase family protein molybdopterin-binding subunit n=1 Tax=uncultured Sneathiella sp. TaxID=879315 RepID=UPI0030EDD70B|tara:strand:+ start:4591 stop:6855 length:2265 start_codon:yes stop_codon:yes gene_type:complete